MRPGVARMRVVLVAEAARVAQLIYFHLKVDCLVQNMLGELRGVLSDIKRSLNQMPGHIWRILKNGLERQI